MTRITLPTRDDLTTDEQRATWDEAAARGPVLNVTRVFLVNPHLKLQARQAWTASGLEPRQRELLILRAALQRQSTYEWHQHVRIARGEGVTDDEIRALRRWRDSDLFSASDRAILRYVDALAAGRPDDEAWAAISAGRTESEVLGITYLVTLYFQLAHIMRVIDLDTETDFIGWEI